MFYNDAKKAAIKRLKDAETRYNSLGESAQDKALTLYEVRKSAAKAIDRVEKYINTLANTPKEFIKQVGAVKVSLKEFNQAIEIEEQNASNNIKGASMAGTGTVMGGAIAALGPSAAMAIATTFGTASTGTAIATLSGAAATNAALAWLGGGAVAAGGGGMAAGNAILAMAGPIGWTVAGVLAVGGGTFAIIKNRKAAKEATSAAEEVMRRIAELTPRIKKLEELINATKKLKTALDLSLFTNTYPKDYTEFSVDQKQALGALINNTRALGELINERIK